MSSSSILQHLLHRGLRARVPLYRIPLTANHRRLHLQWAHEHRASQAYWHQLVFSDESRFNLWDHNGLQSALSNDILHRRYVLEVLHPEVVPFLQGIPGAIFKQDNARPHVAKTVRDFCSAQHMQLPPWPAYSLNMLPIEHVWDLIGRRLARDPRLAASKEELLLRIQAIWNSLPQSNIQNVFHSMPRRLAALIAARGGYTKY